jgi:hypothetical protein
MSILLKDGRKVIASNFTEDGSVEVREVGCCDTFIIKADEVNGSSGLLNPMEVLKGLESGLSKGGSIEELTTFLVKEARFISMVGVQGSLKDIVTLLSMYKNMLSVFNRELANYCCLLESKKLSNMAAGDDEGVAYWQECISEIGRIQEKFTL